jgi:competence protein ComEC
MIKENRDIKARTLVFPHHGGLANGDDPEEIGRLLSSAVEPEMILFSMGRTRFSNPSPKVVKGVRSGAPNAHIACTQLSKACHAGNLPEETTERPEIKWPSHGASKGICCSGTIQITVDGDSVSYNPPISSHKEFITLHVEQPRCLSS